MDAWNVYDNATPVEMIENGETWYAVYQDPLVILTNQAGPLRLFQYDTVEELEAAAKAVRRYGTTVEVSHATVGVEGSDIDIIEEFFNELEEDW